MLEAAYVLPLILVAMLSIVDAVNYAMDAMQSTQIVQNAYDVIMSQSQERSVNAAATVTLVKCASGKVDLDTVATQTFIKDGVEKVLGKALAPSDTVTVTKWDASPVNSYVIDVNVGSSTIFLPESFAFKIHTKGIVSIDYTCN